MDKDNNHSVRDISPYAAVAAVALVLLAALMFATTAQAQTPATWNATITWTPPTTRADGSPVDLRGFYVYRGAAADALFERTFVPGGATATYSFAALPTGTSYFAVAAVDTAGNESEVSAIVSKAITGSVCDSPAPAPVAWRVAKNLTYATRPAYPLLAGKRSTTATGRATVGAVCNCAAPMIEGTVTYCTADSAPLVAICAKVAP